MPVDTEIDRLAVVIEADTGPLTAGLSDLGRSLDASVGGPLENVNRSLRTAFDRTLSSVEEGFVRVARTGEFSFRDMANSILSDLARIGFQEFVAGPIRSLVRGIGGVVFGGARAEGGPVSPGRSYLVGERGPELFLPGAHGQIVPQGGARAPTVVVNVSAPDPGAVLRSEAQISAMLSRSLARAQRHL